MKKNYTLEDIKRIISKLQQAQALTDEEKQQLINACQNSITANHSGKMEDMSSISTSVLLNVQCQKNALNDDWICSHCYALTLLKMRRALDEKLEINHIIYTSVILPKWALPKLSNLWHRFEAFGDLNNKTQVINYFNICKANKQTHCALWTKNPQFIKQAIEDGHKKPANLRIVYSSPILNRKSENIMKTYNFIDTVFTVYDSKTIESENININCGARHCATCLKCYKVKNTEINEKLK